MATKARSDKAAQEKAAAQLRRESADRQWAAARMGETVRPMARCAKCGDGWIGKQPATGLCLRCKVRNDPSHPYHHPDRD